MFRKAALVQGSLDLLILQALAAGRYHGLDSRSTLRR